MEPISKETSLVRRSEFLTERVRQLAQQVRVLGLTEISGRQDARAYFEQGLSRYDLSQYGQAIQDFGEAIRLDPTVAATHYFRAVSYTHLRAHETLR